MVGATVQYTEPKLSSLASSWGMKIPRVPDLVNAIALS